MGKKQKMSFYIPTELYSKLRKAASRTKRTMTSIVVEATSSEIDRLSPKKKVPQ
jgi:predicted DNA-binding protein